MMHLRNVWGGLLAVAVSAALCGSVLFAEDKKVVLKVGDAAPKFECQDDAGETWKSEDHVGKKTIVIYFYPADLTGGCTKQACGFRDDMAKLKDQGVEVVGVSGDSAKNHQIFKKVHNLNVTLPADEKGDVKKVRVLNFTLLADEKGDVAKAFGVPLKPGATIKQTIDGKEIELTRGVTAARWTFVIDKQGKIAMKNTEVKAADDSKAILKFLADKK